MKNWDEEGSYSKNKNKSITMSNSINIIKEDKKTKQSQFPPDAPKPNELRGEKVKKA